MGSDCLYNIDHLNLYGGELEASVEVGQRFRATVSYVYQNFDAAHTGYEEDWTYYLPALLPRHKIKLLGRYMVWPDGWFQVSSRWVDERNTQKGGVLDEYISADVGFEQTFTYDGMKYKASAYVNNVTGTDYQEQAGYSMPKHVWGVQVGVDF